MIKLGKVPRTTQITSRCQVAAHTHPIGYTWLLPAHSAIQPYTLCRNSVAVCTCSYHAAWPCVARGEVDDLVILWPQHGLLLIAVLMEDNKTKSKPGHFQVDSWGTRISTHLNTSQLVSLCWMFMKVVKTFTQEQTTPKLEVVESQCQYRPGANGHFMHYSLIAKTIWCWFFLHCTIFYHLLSRWI